MPDFFPIAFELIQNKKGKIKIDYVNTYYYDMDSAIFDWEFCENFFEALELYLDTLGNFLIKENIGKLFFGYVYVDFNNYLHFETEGRGGGYYISEIEFCIQ